MARVDVRADLRPLDPDHLPCAPVRPEADPAEQALPIRKRRAHEGQVSDRAERKVEAREQAIDDVVEERTVGGWPGVGRHRSAGLEVVARREDHATAQTIRGVADRDLDHARHADPTHRNPWEVVREPKPRRARKEARDPSGAHRSNTARPPTNVRSTDASAISSGGCSNRLRSSTTRSARLPTSIEPERSSRWFTYAEPIVAAASAVGRSRRWSGRNGSSPPSGPAYGKPGGIVRFTATWISQSGFGLETGQSLPTASTAPERARLRNGYWSLARSGPRNGTVSSVICGSLQAQSGCALATTPRARNRRRSSGWITWMCAMWCRRSPNPFARRAASIASRASRTARSPIACTCTWNPSASSRATCAFSSSGSK